MRDTTKAVKDYDLKLQLVEGSTAAMTAALKSAVDRKEWIVATVWEPSWMIQKFDVKFLKDPKGVYPPPQSYYWIGQQGFLGRKPACARSSGQCLRAARGHHRHQCRGEATARRWIRPSRIGPTAMPTF